MILSIQQPLNPLRTNLFKLLILLVLLILVNNMYAQSAHKQLLVYKDFFFLNSSTTFNYEDYDPSFLNDYGYAIAYQKSKGERKYRQYELKYAGANSTDLETELKRVEVQLSYRRGKYWRKPISENIRPRHSLSGQVYYIYEDIDPFGSSSFPIDNRAYGIEFNYFIGVDIKLARQLNLLVDCSLIAVSMGYDFQNTRDPTLTLRQQEQGGYDFDLGFQRVLKIGLSISL